MRYLVFDLSNCNQGVRYWFWMFNDREAANTFRRNFTGEIRLSNPIPFHVLGPTNKDDYYDASRRKVRLSSLQTVTGPLYATQASGGSWVGYKSAVTAIENAHIGCGCDGMTRVLFPSSGA